MLEIGVGSRAVDDGCPVFELLEKIEILLAKEVSMHHEELFDGACEYRFQVGTDGGM